MWTTNFPKEHGYNLAYIRPFLSFPCSRSKLEPTISEQLNRLDSKKKITAKTLVIHNNNNNNNYYYYYYYYYKGITHNMQKVNKP